MLVPAVGVAGREPSQDHPCGDTPGVLTGDRQIKGPTLSLATRRIDNDWKFRT
jgi:hypothetical protein